MATDNGGPAFAHQAQLGRVLSEHPMPHWPGPQWGRRTRPAWKPSDPSPHMAGSVEGCLMYTSILHCLLWAGLNCASLTTAVAGPMVGLLPSFSVAMKLGLLPVGRPSCLGLICQALWASHQSVPHAKWNHECSAIVWCLSP